MKGDGVKKLKKLRPGRVRRWAPRVAYLLFLVLLLELGSRVYLAAAMKAPLLRPGQGMLLYYPELREARNPPPAEGKNPLKVLFLGGSVLAPGELDIQSVLTRRLRQKTGRPVQVVNVAKHGHSSLDSLHKYRMLGDQRYDLVLLYHAINEVRANICPAEVFRADYSHMLWYRLINRFAAHPEINALAHPYVAHSLAATISERIWPPSLIPMKTDQGEVTPEGDYDARWLDHGARIKTGPSLRANIEQIIRLARHRGQPLLLLTFAHYLAPGYTLEKFEQKRLDYGKHEVPTEVWGRPANVVKGVIAHNQVIRALAARKDPHVQFLDMARAIPRDGKHFDDICHFSLAGRTRFVESLLPAAQTALKP